MLRGLLTGAALLALTACQTMGPLGGAPVTSAQLAGGVNVAAPAGYCLDPQVTKPGRGFAFLAACASLDPASDVAFPDTIALITIQVGGPGSAIVAGSEAEFRAFLETEQGTTLLGVSDIGGPVEVVTTDAGANSVSVYTRDTTPPDIVGSQPESWRSFTDLRGRVVTVTVRGLNVSPLAQSQSRDLLDQTMSLLRRANTTTPNSS